MTCPTLPQDRPKGEPPRSVWVTIHRNGCPGWVYSTKAEPRSYGWLDSELVRYDLHRPKPRRKATRAGRSK